MLFALKSNRVGDDVDEVPYVSRLLVLLETYRGVWRGRCLPGGGDDALEVFSVALKQFIPSDQPEQL